MCVYIYVYIYLHDRKTTDSHKILDCERLNFCCVCVEIQQHWSVPGWEVDGLISEVYFGAPCEQDSGYVKGVLVT